MRLRRAPPGSRQRLFPALFRMSLVIGFGNLPAVAGAGIELPQADGTTLSLHRPAARLITLAPHLTELVYAAGAGDRLLATVSFSDFPAEAAALPRIGDAFRLDLERILAYRPDLVLAWHSGNPRAAVARLQSLGLATWVVEIRRPEEIAEVLQQIGLAAGTPESAQAAAAATRRRIDSIHREYAGQTAITYFYQVDARPLYTINGEHLIARALALCGGRNVFADAGSLAPQVSHEAVIAANPQVMLAPTLDSGDDPLAQWREWPALEAVRQGALHLLPADQISRPTPRLLDAVASACSLMHAIRSGSLID